MIIKGTWDTSHLNARSKVCLIGPTKYGKTSAVIPIVHAIQSAEGKPFDDVIGVAMRLSQMTSDERLREALGTAFRPCGCIEDVITAMAKWKGASLLREVHTSALAVLDFDWSALRPMRSIDRHLLRRNIQICNDMMSCLSAECCGVVVTMSTTLPAKLLRALTWRADVFIMFGKFLTFHQLRTLFDLFGNRFVRSIESFHKLWNLLASQTSLYQAVVFDVCATPPQISLWKPDLSKVGSWMDVDEAKEGVETAEAAALTELVEAGAEEPGPEEAVEGDDEDGTRTIQPAIQENDR